jgi:DNA polymerase-1
MQPLTGRAIAGIDYASQEFLIAAILSQDEAMMKAYQSGDVYTAFARDAGLMPKDGTKKTHEKERNLAKGLVLGVSYDMSPNGLAPRLSRQLGTDVTVERARELIDLFYTTYPDYMNWKDEITKEYRTRRFLSLDDGWTMWGDNDNFRSVGNFPVQGAGAVIMRRAVKFAQRMNIDVIQTLHDAIYIEYNSDNMQPVRDLIDIMGDSFDTVMSAHGKTVPIRLEGETWSPDFTPEVISSLNLPEGVQCMREYVDAKGRADYERFRKYIQ